MCLLRGTGFMGKLSIYCRLSLTTRARVARVSFSECSRTSGVGHFSVLAQCQELPALPAGNVLDINRRCRYPRPGVQEPAEAEASDAANGEAVDAGVMRDLCGLVGIGILFATTAAAVLVIATAGVSSAHHMAGFGCQYDCEVASVEVGPCRCSGHTLGQRCSCDCGRGAPAAVLSDVRVSPHIIRTRSRGRKHMLRIHALCIDANTSSGKLNVALQSHTGFLCVSVHTYHREPAAA